MSRDIFLNYNIMKLLRDVNGKMSSKRFIGMLGTFATVLLVFINPEISETLILGMLGIFVGVLGFTTFERYKINDIPPKDKDQKPPDSET